MPTDSFSFAFQPGKNMGEEFVRVLGQVAGRAQGVARQQGAVAEAIHDTRVLIKRMRALLWFAGGTLPATEKKAARLQLREASHLLAPYRDRSVLQATLEKLAQDVSDRKDRKAVVQTAQGPELPQAVDEESRRSLRQAVAILLGAIEGTMRSAKKCAEWPDPSQRLKAAFRAAKKTGRRALDDGDAAQFHEWRKKTKRLLYQLELIYPEPGKRMVRLIKRVDKLQGKLGDHHDECVAQERLKTNPPAKLSRKSVKRSIELLEKKKRRLRKKVRKIALADRAPLGKDR